MGFWHGANWTFIVWGLYHASLVTIHRITSKYTKAIPFNARNVLGWGISLPFLMLGWNSFGVFGGDTMNGNQTCMIQAPYDEGPVGPMPQSAQQHRDHEVHIGPELPHAVPAEGNV